MSKRMIAIFSIFCVLMSLLNVRVATLTASEELKETALNQRSYTLTVGKTRGQIYDRSFKSLVNTESTTVSAVLPQPETTAGLLDAVEEAERDTLYQSIKQGRPFLTDLLPKDTKADGVLPVEVAKRYGGDQIASHIIGYVDGEGKGVAGIEKAYDDFLSQAGETIEVNYTLNGLGEALKTGNTAVKKSGDAASGVVLTIDREIQAVCENIGSKMIGQGAVVVMEPSTGKLLACASFPEYDPNDIAASLEKDGGPLLNRSFSAFPVGSTFKTVLSAAALESGAPASLSYDCTGLIDVSGQLFHCHLLSGHGTVDMRKAMIESCNPYYVSLGLELGPEKILEFASNLSFGRQTELADGLFTSAGILPDAGELVNPAAVANLSFGQGRMLATPIQLCQMTSSVVNGGRTPIAQLVEGITRDGETLSEVKEGSAPLYAMSEETAQTLRTFLEACVEEKENMKAKPTRVSAAGKTGTAQTGRFDEAGVEKLDAWFAGYFPAESPRYAVAVVVEDGKTGNASAGPVFAEIADQLTLLEEIREELGTR